MACPRRVVVQRHRQRQPEAPGVEITRENLRERGGEARLLDLGGLASKPAAPDDPIAAASLHVHAAVDRELRQEIVAGLPQGELRVDETVFGLPQPRIVLHGDADGFLDVDRRGRDLWVVGRDELPGEGIVDENVEVDQLF